MDVLNYATASADGLPDRHLVAEELIDRGKGPNALRHLFRKSEHAAMYFAKSMQTRFPLVLESSPCACCGVATDRLVRLAWTTKARPRTLEFKLSDGQGLVPFETYHAICGPCRAPWEVLTRRHRLLYRILIGTGVLAGLCAVLSFILRSTSNEQGRWLFLVWLPMVLLVAILFRIVRWRNRRAVPHPMSLIRRRGVWLTDFPRISDVNSLLEITDRDER